MAGRRRETEARAPGLEAPPKARNMRFQETQSPPKMLGFSC